VSREIPSAASTPTYKEKKMAIGDFGIINDPRNIYGYNAQERYEREMQYRRLQDEEYRRMQNSSYADSATLQQGKIGHPTPKQDPKDPLAFLTKTDNKLLLTGEAP
jgi:hypothetical protein